MMISQSQAEYQMTNLVSEYQQYQETAVEDEGEEDEEEDEA